MNPERVDQQGLHATVGFAVCCVERDNITHEAMQYMVC